MRKSTFSPEYGVLRRELVAIRLSAGLSQRALATRLSVPPSWVSKVETGERRLDLVELSWFCKGCGKSPSTVAKAILGAMEKGAKDNE
ncbi:MAG: helix-turn-helix transcriptional regulator [Planctomycetota bacterium]|nr:helix-turn-helix transcriptional regulator [Planctomycetota bacterium]